MADTPHIDTKELVVATARSKRPARPAGPVFTFGWLWFLVSLSIAAGWGNGVYHAVMGDSLSGIFLAAVTPPIVIMGIAWWVAAAFLIPASQRSSH